MLIAKAQKVALAQKLEKIIRIISVSGGGS
jgi:hypothetical protein